MQGFFENTLFSPPLGPQSERLTDFLADRLATMAGEIRSVESGGLTDDFDIGLSFVPGGSTLSGLGEAALGKVLDGLTDEALDSVKDLTVEEERRRLIEGGEARILVRAAIEEIEGLAAGTVHHYGEWAEAVESGLGEN